MSTHIMFIARCFWIFAFVVLQLLISRAQTRGQSVVGLNTLNPAPAENSPPSVRILFPPPGTSFHYIAWIRLRAFAEDLDGTIKEVRFYFETNLIGIVTKPPYEFISTKDDRGRDFSNPSKSFSAVAVDDSGSITRSESVVVDFAQHAFGNYLVIEDENGYMVNGGYIHTSATSINLRARLGDSDGYGGPVDFFLGTNKIGTVENPPYLITVPPLPEGQYALYVGTSNWAGGYDMFPEVPASRIKIITPSLKNPAATDEGKFSFDFQGTLPRATNIIEASENLRTWSPISTNITTTNAFPSLHSMDSASGQRFFRVKLFPQEPVLP